MLFLRACIGRPTMEMASADGGSANGAGEEHAPLEVGDVGEVEGVEMLREVVCHVLRWRAALGNTFGLGMCEG